MTSPNRCHAFLAWLNSAKARDWREFGSFELISPHFSLFGRGTAKKSQVPEPNQFQPAATKVGFDGQFSVKL
jgi:hypothetical protein